MSNVILQQQIIDTLNILAPRDRDLKSITITLNPNYCKGSDMDLKESIKKELNTMIKQGLIKQNKLEFHICIGHNGNYKTAHRVFTIYSLNKF